MPRADVDTYEELINSLFIQKEDSTYTYEQPYLRVPIPFLEEIEQNPEVKEESSRVIIIDI